MPRRFRPMGGPLLALGLAGLWLVAPGCQATPPANHATAPAPQPTITVGQVIVIGLVEGLTEFLPVSSTGHLALLDESLGLRDTSRLTPRQIAAVKAFEIVIQFGAILAVFVLYADRIGAMVLGLIGQSPTGRRVFANLVLAFVPTAIIGLTLDKLGVIQSLQHTGPVVAATLLGGVVMILFERSHFTGRARATGLRLEELAPQAAVAIGFCQCLAMWPGTSRSMVTIMAGMILGLAPTAAAEFSFLLGLATLSAASFWKLRRDGQILREEIGTDIMILGLVVAALAAALAISTFVAILNRRGLEPFGWYRIALAAVMLLVLGSRDLA